VNDEHEQTPSQRRNLLVLGLAGGLGILALVVALAALLLTGTAAAGTAASDPNVVKVTRYSSSCLDTQYKDLGRNHTQDLSAKIAYNSFPPTSGTHYYIPAVWGNYPTPIAQVQGVHNLEHGGIDIQYGDKVSSADKDAMFAYYDNDPVAILMAPLPRIGTRIAITAWTHLMVCQKWDKGAVDKFRDKYRFKGPESPVLSMAALQPGQ
jgi:hypothetical protein